MTKEKLRQHLQNLSDNELSSSTNNKTNITSGYNSLIEILQKPNIAELLYGCHSIVFKCISQIILTPIHEIFSDEQLQFLLELAANSRTLSMFQNQTIDAWLLNLEERIFEKPDYDNHDNNVDDDDLYEDINESEESNESIKKQSNVKSIVKQNRNKRKQEKRVLFADQLSDKSKLITEPLSHQGHTRIIYNDSNRYNNSRREGTSTVDTATYKSQNSRKTKQKKRFNEKYAGDHQFYNCYVCGELGHVQYDCPLREGNGKCASNDIERGMSRKNSAKRKIPPNPQSLSSLSDTPIDEHTENNIQQILNISSKLINNCHAKKQSSQLLDDLVTLTERLQKIYPENLSKMLVSKQSMFYPLFSHVAFNEFLFSNEEYLKLYRLKNILLSQKKKLLNENREKFCRNRELIELQAIADYIRNSEQTETKQMKQTIFNDFQEYIMRSKTPISIYLFDLIKHLLQEKIYVEKSYFENFINKILFDLKKDIFSDQQLHELRSLADIRNNGYELNALKQIWNERLLSFQSNNLLIDFNEWLSEFERILNKSSDEIKSSAQVCCDHSMWYFAVLSIASSGHLKQEQYDHLLKTAIQSSFFNSIQKFYFKFYLNETHAPITIEELNEIKLNIESTSDKKKVAYQQIIVILDRTKPEFTREEIEQSSLVIDDQSTSINDIIPIIDHHILSRLMSLTEIICSDTDTFSNDETKQILDKFLEQSAIVRPLSSKQRETLMSYYSRPLSLRELQRICSSIDFNVDDLRSVLQNKRLYPNYEMLDYLTNVIIKIFKNLIKYPTKVCQELKDAIDTKMFGKVRCKLINEIHMKYRINKKTYPSLNPKLLHELLAGVLSNKEEAYTKVFDILEDIAQILDFENKTIEFEANRCLLSAIILILIDTKRPTKSSIQQRLKMIIKNDRETFILILTEYHIQLVETCMTSFLDIDQLIQSIKTKSNPNSFQDLIRFIKNDLDDADDFKKLIDLAHYTFDDQCLSNEQTHDILTLMLNHSKFHKNKSKNTLYFLIDLLKNNIHSSPKEFQRLLQNNEDKNQTIDKIQTILLLENGDSARMDWKETIVEILITLFNEQCGYRSLNIIAQKSPMLEAPSLKAKLEPHFLIQQSKNKRELSAIPKNISETSHSENHREMFEKLESNDATLNSVVVEQLRSILIAEKLPNEILHAKFIQALGTVIKRSEKKFRQVSLDEWTVLISKNRGKIFSNDNECDQLLMMILYVRLKLPTNRLDSITHSIQSKKVSEKLNGFEELILLLKHTPIKSREEQINGLPTISKKLYNLIKDIVFTETFSNKQIRQCLTLCKNSWLLTEDTRQRVSNLHA